MASTPIDDGSVEEPRPTKRQRLNPSIEMGLMRDGSGRDSSASFVGSASGIHFIRSVYGALGAKATRNPKHIGNTPDSNIVPGEDDRLDGGPSKSIWYANEVDSREDAVPKPYTFEDLLDWTGSYFDIWHPPFPFLHAPTVLERLEALTQNNNTDTAGAFDLVIIKAIMSISLADRRQTKTVGRPVPRHLVFNTFEDALNSIHDVMAKPAFLQALQAAVCVQLFLVSMLRLNAASKLGGLIIRLSFQLGLHRCPTRYSSFKKEEGELRRRLFWSIYSIDRHICQALGLPLTIRDDDVDVCYPDNEVHPSRPGNGGSGVASRQDSPAPDGGPEQDDRLRLLTLIAKHAEIRGLIMELRNKNVEQRAKGWERAVLINTKLTQWWNQVEDSIDQAELHGAPLSALHQTVLKVLKHESVISLNRPLLASSKSSPNYAAALQSCISASKSIIKALNAITHPVPTFTSPTNGQQSHSPLFWPSFTWAIWMSAFIILYAALENEIDYHVAVRSTDRALQILSKLAARGIVWPNGCAVAIRDLRSTLDESRGGQSTDRRDVHPIATAGDDETTATPLSRTLDSHALGSSQPTSNLQDFRASHDTPLLDGPGDGVFFPETMLGNSWLDLGMDLGPDLPIFPSGGLDPLQGFDIPFWVGQDNYATWMGS
ncbi:hypothetical protein H2200_007443 [Cladophialophora chaetospira]|uniref:Xylanolytic transcriptional activator regulatory domain-containing protein n=1 Tax=Cladophialophora chaetospira TaxID=386627 RepID=A0AA39CHQ5_9EURO|nr:hypothetical protein H2200_007443 [Cladophialophora chaetospira]